MDFKNIRVLVTDGDGRQTLTIIHGLKELGCHISVLCASKLDVCYSSRIPDEKILDKRAQVSNVEYIDFLINILESGKYDVLLPVAEMSTNKITLAENEIGKLVKMACAPRKAYIQAFDKQHTFDLAVENKIPCPLTRKEGQSIEEYLCQVNFPLIIKPRNGVGSIGFHKFEKEEDFFPYIKENKINLDNYVLQEYVSYKKRLGTILFIDQKGNICMSYADEVLRWFPIDAGSASLIRSIDYPEIIDYSSRLLTAMGWQGVAALSFMVDTVSGEPKLLEVNGRIPASIRLSMQCGFNVAKLLIEMAYDEKVDIYPPNKNFGQLTRHFHAEIPWFIKSKDRFSAKPSWFSWKNTKDVVFWRDDPKPWFAYTVQKFIGYKESMKKRQH